VIRGGSAARRRESLMQVTLDDRLQPPRHRPAAQLARAYDSRFGNALP